jgi:hypothetical protein
MILISNKRYRNMSCGCGGNTPQIKKDRDPPKKPKEKPDKRKNKYKNLKLKIGKNIF